MCNMIVITRKGSAPGARKPIRVYQKLIQERNHPTLAEFSMYPLDSVHLSKDLANAVEILENAGLPYQLGPMRMCMEGDWDQVLSTIRRCHLAMTQKHGRVVTTIVIDDHNEQAHSLKEMVSSVEQQVALKRGPKPGIDTQCQPG
jgi:uncharacterized protein (TIGR00106 family)